MDNPPEMHIPHHILRKLYYDRETKELCFNGMMSQHEKNELISLDPKNVSFGETIDKLYHISQIPILKQTNATLISYEPSSGENLTNELNVDFETLNQAKCIINHSTSDVAAVEIASVESLDKGVRKIMPHRGVTNASSKFGKFISLGKHSLKKFNDVLVGNEVYIFGYPTSLSLNPDIGIKKPLLRKGIVAGKNEIFKTIILDCPVYYGNSGGLVIEVETTGLNGKSFKAIGIVTKLVPFLKENSGYSIAEPIDRLIELLRN